MVGLRGRGGLLLHTLSTRFSLVATMAIIAFDNACGSISVFTYPEWFYHLVIFVKQF